MILQPTLTFWKKLVGVLASFTNECLGTLHHTDNSIATDMDYKLTASKIRISIGKAPFARKAGELQLQFNFLLKYYLYNRNILYSGVSRTHSTKQQHVHRNCLQKAYDVNLSHASSADAPAAHYRVLRSSSAHYDHF